MGRELPPTLNETLIKINQMNRLKDMYEKISQYQLENMLDPVSASILYEKDYINTLFDAEFKYMKLNILANKKNIKLRCFELQRPYIYRC